MERVRGTCVAIGASGVLLRGPSGAGKSDLALRLIDGGARLVADDYTVVRRDDGRLVATAPDELRGLLEVRGIGIVRFDPLGSATLIAAIDLSPRDEIDRLPASEHLTILGIPVPLFAVAAQDASAPAKVRLIAGIASGAVEQTA